MSESVLWWYWCFDCTEDSNADDMFQALPQTVQCPQCGGTNLECVE